MAALADHRLIFTFLLCLSLPMVARAQDAEHGSDVPQVALRVRSVPSGARVILLGPPARNLGQTPIRRANVPRGLVTLRFELEGYTSVDLPVQARRRALVRATLVAIDSDSLVGDSVAGEVAPGEPVVVELAPDDPGAELSATNESATLLAQNAESVPAGTAPEELVPEVSVPALVHEHDSPSFSVDGLPPGARVQLDGEFVGTLPLSRASVSEGMHELSVQAEGYTPETRSLHVQATGEHLIRVVLRPVSGQLHVTFAGASASVDGRPVAPELVFTGLSEGRHSVRFTLPGYMPETVECEVGPEGVCRSEVHAIPLEGQLQVDSEPPGAQVRVDGQRVGSSPWEGSVTTGMHTVELGLEGRESSLEAVDVPAAGIEHRISLLAQEQGGISTASENTASAPTIRGATPLEPGTYALAFAAGYPFLAQVEALLGLHEMIGVGVAARSFGRLTEFELQGRFGLPIQEMLDVGARLRIGGGVGPDDTNTLFASLEGIATLRPLERVSISALLALDVHSDHYLFSALGGERPLLYADERQEMLRLRLGVGFDLALADHWTLFGNFDFVALDGSDGGDVESTRTVLGNLFDSGQTDPRAYGQLGVAVAF